MKKKNGHPYRAGVPERDGIGGADPNAAWRAYRIDTGAYLGPVSRYAPDVHSARKRAAGLYAVPEADVRVEKVKR
jgi:hypothetical protein